MSTISTTLSTLIIFFLLITTTSVYAVNFSVVSHPSKLQLPIGDPIEGSPGSRTGSIVTCNRVHIHGLSRLRHLRFYAHALKIRVSVAQGDSLFRIQTVEICSHWNVSIGVGMCPSTQWEKLSKGTWVRSVSSFGSRILDIRMLPDPSRSIEISTNLEFMLHRVLFLVMGLVMMMTARVLSESVVFYYGSAMTIGIILVILMVLFQGMKLLPTGRKSSFAIFVYSSIVGVATFLLQYLSGLLKSLLMEIGISEDMHNPLGIFLLVCLGLGGAWFGYWGVRRLVLTDDGSVDSGVAYFVEWAILIFSAVMIIQSSLDTLLALQALVLAIMMTAIVRANRKSRFLRHMIKKMWKRIHITQDLIYDQPRARARHLRPTPCNSPSQGLIRTPVPSGKGSYYSTFHQTPERKKFSKEEWENFTKENTSDALKKLVSSPEFHKWAIDKADRITLTPPKDANLVKKRSLFRWY